MPAIRNFTHDAAVFEDGTELAHIDTVILATGYEYRVPFLTVGGHLDVVALQRHGTAEYGSHNGTANEYVGEIEREDTDELRLRTNLRYIWPLFRHVLSLDAAYPLGALYIVGAPIFTSSAFCTTAQALFVSHTLADLSLLNPQEDIRASTCDAGDDLSRVASLSPRAALLADLHAQEAELRAGGLDPAVVGHRLLETAGVYQDALIRYLQVRGVAGHGSIPPVTENFTPAWRTTTWAHVIVLKRAWKRVEAEGKEGVKKWLDGVESEEEWVGVMDKLLERERERLEEEGERKGQDGRAATGPSLDYMSSSV